MVRGRPHLRAMWAELALRVAHHRQQAAAHEIGLRSKAIPAANQRLSNLHVRIEAADVRVISGQRFAPGTRCKKNRRYSDGANCGVFKVTSPEPEIHDRRESSGTRRI